MTHQPHTTTKNHIDFLDPFEDWMKTHPKITATIGWLFVPASILICGLIEH